jgi:hypothetical protein
MVASGATRKWRRLCTAHAEVGGLKMVQVNSSEAMASVLLEIEILHQN